MPWDKIEDAPQNLKALSPEPGGEKKVKLTLAQINKIGEMYDALKKNENIEEPMAVAITNFRKAYECDGKSWKPKKKDKLEEDPDQDQEQLEDTEETTEEMETETTTEQETEETQEEQESEELAEKDAKKAQKLRSETYGIAIKDKSNGSKPSGLGSLRDAQFGDPVNYMYPVDKDHVLASVKRFNSGGARTQGMYSSGEWTVIGKRIAESATAALDQKYAFRNGMINKVEEKWSIPMFPEDGERVWDYAETHEIDNFPFFKTGTHNGHKYSSKDLDKIVDNFNSLQDSVKPVLKLGHGPQKFLKDEGLPAIGWVEKVRRKGSILYADIKNIPKRIFELIKDKAYSRPSAEIYVDYKDSKGKKHGLTLSAIALLGGDTPAVKDLPDIEALYNTEAYASVMNCYNENLSRQEEGMIMPEDVLTEEQEEQAEEKEEETTSTVDVQKYESEIDRLKKENASLKSKAEKVDELESEKAKAEETQRVSEIRQYVEGLKEQGKVLPVMEAPMMALLSSLPTDQMVTFSDNGDEAEDLKPMDLVGKIFDKMPNIVEFDELSKQDAEDKKESREAEYRALFTSDRDKDIELGGLELAALAEKIAADEKIELEEAMVKAEKQLEG